MVATPGATPRQTMVRRCSALLTAATRMRVSLPSAVTESLPATAALPPATAPAAVATTSAAPPRPLRRRQRVISSSRLREARGGVWLGSGRRQGPASADCCNAALLSFSFFPASENETSMGPEGRVSNCGSLVNALCVLFPCRVVILRKDNLTWRVWDALSLTRCLRCSETAKKIVRGCTKGPAVHPSLDLALCIAVPEGHGLGEMRQLSGSNEGGSREGREKKNAREGTCLAPSRGMREREHEQTRAEKCGKRLGNQISNEHQEQLRLRKSEPTTESK